MRICFKRVEINNFLSIGHAKVELDNRGYILVNGVNNCTKDNAKSNGSGKSAIYDSILWALTGVTSRGVKDVTNLFGDDGALVEVTFDIDGKEYKLIRAKNHSKYKTDLKIYVNGENKSGKGLRDSEKILEDLIPDLTIELLGGVVLLGQGMPFRFTNNPPSKRKEILEQLSKSDFMIEDVKNRIAERRAEVKSEIDRLNRIIIEEQTKLGYAQKQIDENQRLLNAIENQSNDNIDVDISNCEVFIANLTADNENFNKSIVGYNEQKKMCNEDMIDILSQKFENNGDIVDAQNKFEEAKANCQKVATKAEEIKKQFTMLDSVVDVCPTCKQKLPNVVKIDTSDLHKQYDELKVEFNKLKEEATKLNDCLVYKKGLFDEYINNRKKRINESLNALDGLIKVSQSAINDNTERIKKKEVELNQLKENKANRQFKIKLYNDTIEELHKVAQEYESCIKLHKAQYDDIVNRDDILTKFESLAKRDFRGYLLSNVIAYIDKVAKMYCLDIFKTQDMSIGIDGNDINVVYNGKQYEALSGGERQKVDIIVQLAIRDMLKTFMDFSSNIIVFDEMFDFLDNVGADALMQSIANRLQDVSSVFIVTHHTDIDIPCDDIITVTKNENGVSTI